MNRPPLTVGGRLGEYIVRRVRGTGARSLRGARGVANGIAETVDVSMLEAMQLTYVTTPTAHGALPGGPAAVVPLGDDPG